MRDFFIHFFLPNLFLCFFQTVVTIADKNHLTFVSILYNEWGVLFNTKKLSLSSLLILLYILEGMSMPNSLYFKQLR